MTKIIHDPQNNIMNRPAHLDHIKSLPERRSCIMADRMTSSIINACHMSVANIEKCKLSENSSWSK